MKKLLWTGAVALAMTIGAGATAQTQGDWVLGQWRGGSDWYPGVVTARTGNQVTIRYDDGTSETRPVNQVRPYNWRVGSRVVCRFTDGSWYDATITGMAADGLTISVRYADGDTQTTNTGRCRSE
ncbi:MAG TPA: agenet domain-containing protein [Allosphingosinicella sp.]|nr:agenet domain-containing protein [Allosphingosinicella sp.]